MTLPDGDRDIVEHYTRYAKVLVDGGTTDADSTLTDFGFRLELHALQNPYRLGHGAPLELRLTWDGRPASGLLVKAFCAAAADRQQRARSDGEGRVTIEPDCTGTWLVNAVRLEPSTESGIDFESYWTSLTFQRP